MHEAVIVRGKKRTRWQMPANWEGVDPWMWDAMAKALLLGNTPIGKVAMSAAMLHNDNRITIPAAVLSQLDPVEVAEIANLAAWPWEEPLQRPIFEAFTHEGVEYLLPKARMTNAVVIEYAMADTMYALAERAAKAGNTAAQEEYTCKLIAYISRPADPRIDPTDSTTYRNDLREKFNQPICDARVESLRRLPDSTKLGVQMFFVGCKRAIHESCKNVIFSEAAKEGEEVASGRAMRPTEWLDICFNIAGQKFGTFEQTLYTNLWTVIYYLKLQASQE